MTVLPPGQIVFPSVGGAITIPKANLVWHKNSTLKFYTTGEPYNEWTLVEKPYVVYLYCDWKIHT